MPKDDTYTAWYLNAFGVLTRSRQAGMSVNALSLESIVFYWQYVARISPLDEHIAVIQAMDTVYLEHARTKTEKD